MNNVISVTLESLQRKLQQLDQQFQQVQQEKTAVEYLINNLDTLAASIQSSTPNSQSTFLETPLPPKYDALSNTSDLVISVLKTEARKMGWREVAAIVKKVKPDIAESTTQYWLSKNSRDPKKPVNLNQKIHKYWYEEKN